MKGIDRKEEIRKIVREAIQLARSRGLTNQEAISEAAYMLRTTKSRIWTFMYKDYDVKEVSDDEYRRIKVGHIDVVQLDLDYTLYLLEDIRQLRELYEAGPLLPFPASQIPRSRRLQESIEKSPAGFPLWRKQIPRKKPRKARSLQRVASCPL